jgi:hypothetical protein
MLAKDQGKDWQQVPEIIPTADKTAVRIEVVVPSSDRNLAYWPKWAKRYAGPEVTQALIDTGGGKRKAETWYIYNGTIAPDRFRSVCIRDDAGNYVRATPEQVVAIEPVEFA